MNHRTHAIGAPGSIARYLDDHAHNPNAEPFPAPWCVFRYGDAGEAPIVLVRSAQAPDFDVRALVMSSAEGLVLVDVRSYGCKVLPA